MGIFPEGKGPNPDVAEKIRRYDRGRPLENPGVSFENQAEAERIQRMIAARPDLVSGMYNNLLEGRVGRQKVKDLEMEKRVFRAIRDLGLEVRIAGGSSSKVEVFNPSQEKEVPKLEHVFPSELMTMEKRYKAAGIVELDEILPGEKGEKKGEYLVLEIDQRSALAVRVPDNASDEYKKAARARQELVDCMMAHMGQVRDTPAYVVMRADQELLMALNGTDGMVSKSDMDRARIEVLDRLVAERFSTVKNLEVVSHGFAGEKEISVNYELVTRAFRRHKTETAVYLPSLMGADGTLAAKQNGKGVEVVDQSDQARQLEFALAVDGFYHFALTEGKTMGIVGHSMGGEGVLELAAKHQSLLEKVRDEFARRGMKTISEAGALKAELIEKELDRIGETLPHLEAERAKLRRQERLAREEMAQMEESVRWLQQIVIEGIAEKISMLEPVIKQRLAEEAKWKAEQEKWMQEHAAAILSALNTEFDICIPMVSEQPCYNAAVSEPLIKKAGVGGLLDLGHVIAPAAKPVVDTTGSLVNRFKNFFGTLKYGFRHAEAHALSIANLENPTAQELRGIRESVGMDRTTAEALVRSTNRIQVFAGGDDTLDYHAQAVQANELGIDIPTIHIRDADHFGFASPEHHATLSKWERVVFGLTPAEWRKFETAMREAVYMEEGSKRKLIPDGGAVLDVGADRSRWDERFNNSGFVARLEQDFGEKLSENGKVRWMKEAVGASLGRLSFGVYRGSL